MKTSAAAGSNGVAWTFTATEDGEYSITNGALASGHDVHLRLTENGTALTSYDLPYVISLRAEESVTLWVDAYTFSLDTSESTFYDETVTMYVDREGDYNEATAPSQGGEELSGNALIVGENTVTTTADGQTEYYFTAEETGTYTFSSTDVNLLLNAENGTYMLIPVEDLGSFEVVLTAGDSITMTVEDYNFGSTAGNCTVTITMA